MFLLFRARSRTLLFSQPNEKGRFFDSAVSSVSADDSAALEMSMGVGLVYFMAGGFKVTALAE
jgi:hypothetical protein